jgi:hypothetical protein
MFHHAKDFRATLMSSRIRLSESLRRESGTQGTNHCQGTDQGTVQGSQEALKEGLPKSNISPFSESVRGYL